MMRTKGGWETLHIPPELEDNIEELFPGCTYEEALQDQENLYQLLKISSSDRQATASDSEGNISHGQVSLLTGESSHSGSAPLDSQLALDEAFARSLQHLEEEIHQVSISEPVQTDARNNAENPSAGPSVRDRNQDDIDPDQMTYEELRTLGEAIGTESRGLSEKEISRLPYSKCKTGFFSKKDKTAECAICCMEYERRQYITTLPCTHRYHRECINHWLKQKKTCPICLVEVKVTTGRDS
ncbi:hypothetical protein Ancab_009253 [Ancistrocladus abbreviatus]